MYLEDEDYEVDLEEESDGTFWLLTAFSFIIDNRGWRLWFVTHDIIIIINMIIDSDEDDEEEDDEEDPIDGDQDGEHSDAAEQLKEDSKWENEVAVYWFLNE